MVLKFCNGFTFCNDFKARQVTEGSKSSAELQEEGGEKPRLAGHWAASLAVPGQRRGVRAGSPRSPHGGEGRSLRRSGAVACSSEGSVGPVVVLTKELRMELGKGYGMWGVWQGSGLGAGLPIQGTSHVCEQPKQFLLFIYKPYEDCFPCGLVASQVVPWQDLLRDFSLMLFCIL